MKQKQYLALFFSAFVFFAAYFGGQKYNFLKDTQADVLRVMQISSVQWESCSDMDGGIYPDVIGTMTAVRAGGKSFTLMDQNIGENAILEFYHECPV